MQYSCNEQTDHEIEIKKKKNKYVWQIGVESVWDLQCPLMFM